MSSEYSFTNCPPCLLVEMTKVASLVVRQARHGKCQPLSLSSLPPLVEEVAKMLFTITAEIHARALANFYCQYADRHINLKFMRRVSEREPAVRQFVIASWIHSYFDNVMTKFMINNRTDA